MRRKTLVTGFFLLVASYPFVFTAQQPSTSGGDEFHAASPFAGQDPLAGRGEVFPPQGNPPQCVPPVKTWRLLAQTGSECYYFAPYPQRINGYVADMSQVGAIEKLGGRCGVDEFDAGKAVCQNKGDNLPGAKPSTGLPAGISDHPQPDDSTSSTGNYRRQPVPPGYDPCHPNYNMSTPAGRAAAQQNAARDQQACNDERCKHNPNLPFCGGPPISQTVPPGEKGIGRPDDASGSRRPPVPPKSQGPFAYQLQMSKCLESQLPYFFPKMILQSEYVQMARAGTHPEAVDPVQAKIFLQERAMALQAQAYRDERFGANPSGPQGLTAIASQESFAGWLDQCLADAGLALPVDKSIGEAYAAFLGVPDNAPAASAWASGHMFPAPPRSMFPPPPAR